MAIIKIEYALQMFMLYNKVMLLICRDHSNFVSCVQFCTDGSKFITVSSDKKGIIYDAKTGEKIGELSLEDGHKGSIYAVSWSPDGKQVISVVWILSRAASS